MNRDFGLCFFLLVILLVAAIVVLFALTGCRTSGVVSAGAVSEGFYPTKAGVRQWDDPYRSRAAASDVGTSGHTRPPVPGGEK